MRVLESAKHYPGQDMNGYPEMVLACKVRSMNFMASQLVAIVY